MPRIHLTISLGRPDPERLSTAIVWSILAHLGLLAGVLVYQMLPSQMPGTSDAFFVRLAAPPGPKGSGARAAGAAAAEGAASPAPAPPPRETPQPPPAPTKASLPPPQRPPEKAAALGPAKEPSPSKAPSRSHAPEAEPPSGTPTEQATSPAAGDGGGSGTGQGPGAGGVGGPLGTSFGEGDFQYAWYQSALEAKLQSHWRRPIADSAEIEAATVSFTIDRNGTVSGVEISSPSGNSALDLSVIRAVYDANPLPALPKGWSGDSVHVSMQFRLTPGE